MPSETLLQWWTAPGDAAVSTTPVWPYSDSFCRLAQHLPPSIKTSRIVLCSTAGPCHPRPRCAQVSQSPWRQVEGDRLDVWAAPVGPSAHGGASPYATLDEAAWGRHAATAWQVGA